MLRLKGHWNVLLDGKTVKTPKKEALSVPSHLLALAIAAEFQSQAADAVRPSTILTALHAADTEFANIGVAFRAQELCQCEPISGWEP